MMPIRMRGNCRLCRHHDKLPPPPSGPLSETRFHGVMLSLTVLSAVDLDCELPHGRGQGRHQTQARNTETHRLIGTSLEDQPLEWPVWSHGALVLFLAHVCMFLAVTYHTLTYTTQPNQ